MRQGRFEVGAQVTTLARDIDVLAQQRVLCLRVIERHFGVRLLPRKRCMTRVAALLEAALVRVAMAIRAACKWQSSVTDLSIRPRRMAALAQNVAMLARQRIACLRVIEPLLVNHRDLPIRRRVAPGTLAPQASLMFVFVAGSAAW